MGLRRGWNGDQAVTEASQEEVNPASLLTRISNCRICRDEPEGAPLPHEPRPVLQISESARICVAGQAPGTRVHASGQPFTDPSGDRLRDWMGIGPEIFYDASLIAIIPMGFCFPGLNAKGGDLPPRRECAPRWRPEIFRLLPDLKLLLTVGMYAQKWHLDKTAKPTLTETVRHWRDYANSKSGLPVIPLPHPSWRNNSWIRKNPWFESELLPVLQQRIRHVIGNETHADQSNQPD